jgi:nucleotide-binding universal stress UspA family protein
MIQHILAPLDGSNLAECILPHTQAVASAFSARVTLLHVLEFPHVKGNEQAIDPLDWHLKKREAEAYLDHVAARLRENNLQVEEVIMDGLPAECVIDFAKRNEVDLIVLSTHGQSGLSRWNISSVVQKIVLHSYKSTLLVRAYRSTGTEFEGIRYHRVFVGLDCSMRAEYILPVAIKLAQFHKAQLILGTVIRKPEMPHRFPLSEEDENLIMRVVDRNYHAASHYFGQLYSMLSLQGIDLQTRIVISNNVMSALHEMVEQENADLVMLAAHGYSGEGRWPYGSIATSFIFHGNTSLLIMQDLSMDEIIKTMAEMAAREPKGH